MLLLGGGFSSMGEGIIGLVVVSVRTDHGTDRVCRARVISERPRSLSG